MNREEAIAHGENLLSGLNAVIDAARAELPEKDSHTIAVVERQRDALGYALKELRTQQSWHDSTSEHG